MGVGAGFDVLGRRPSQLGGAFTADNALLFGGGLLGANGPAGSLVQSFQATYQQQVNQIFEVGSAYRYYVVGRTQGTMTLGRIVGPISVQTDLLQKLGDVCSGKAEDHTLAFVLGSAPCNWSVPGQGQGQGLMSLIARDVIASNVAYSVQAADMMISENVSCQTGAMYKQQAAA